MLEQNIFNFHYSPEIFKPFQFCVNRKRGGYKAVHDMTHLFYLYFIMEGSGQVITGQEIKEFQKDDIVYVFPGNHCKFVFVGKENRWDWISMEIGNNVEFNCWNHMKSGVLLFAGGVKKSIIEILSRLEADKLSGKERPYKVLGILYTLMDEIYQDSMESPIGKIAGTKDSRSVAKAVDYITLNYYHKIDVDSICHYVNYSRYYFSRRFKEIQGMPITEYINKVRLDRAIYLLSHTDLTVIQVAKSVGFDDPYYFSKKFKAYTGVPPSQFKYTYQ